MTELLEATPAGVGSEPPSSSTSTEATPRPPLGWWSELATLLALIASITVAQGLLYRAPLALALGTIAGLIAGLGCRRWWSAALVGAVGVLGGAFAATLVGGLSGEAISLWLPATLEAAAVAGVLGALAAFALRGGRALRGAVSAVALLAIICTMWYSAISVANVVTSNGQTSLTRMTTEPAISAEMSDEELYIVWVARLRAGEPYYPMVVQSFEEVAAVNGAKTLIRIRSPLSYRPPTLFVLLASLPNNGLSFVIAMMVVSTLGVAAAYLLARQFVGRVAALVSALFAATVFAAYGGAQLLQGESWAGAFALASIAAFAWARSHPKRSRRLQIASIAFALLAVAFREIAAPLLILGLIATSIDAEERSRRTWALWAGGLVLAAVGLGAHWYAASQAFSRVAAQSVSSTWFHPTGAGLVGAMFIVVASTTLAFIVVALLVLIAMVGSIRAPREWPTRVMLAGVVIGGPLMLYFFHPPGFGTANVAPGYWGNILWPTIFASIPLAFARLPRRRTSTAPAHVDVASTDSDTPDV